MPVLPLPRPRERKYVADRGALSGALTRWVDTAERTVRWPVIPNCLRFWQQGARRRVLRGNAGSPGRAHGPAKVMRSLAETSKLQPGDVLVAEPTAPPWTPLFATAAAIVTDTGGILSHCAVVAREYGIPAVVGTGNATRRIHDGQLIEVDGDAGIVRLLK